MGTKVAKRNQQRGTKADHPVQDSSEKKNVKFISYVQSTKRQFDYIF